MSDLQQKYNLKSPAVKRLMREAAELRCPTEQYHAQPLEDNLFEWHFTVQGPVESDFDGGRYHGRIVLPPEYPMKPPSIILMTANGRFEVGKKICLSMSAHHPETWQPSWSIRTVLLALIGFMPTKGGGALGALDYTAVERRALASRSLEWKCETCGVISDSSLAEADPSNDSKVTEEAKELASQINFKGEEKMKSDSTPMNQNTTESMVSHGSHCTVSGEDTVISEPHFSSTAHTVMSQYQNAFLSWPYNQIYNNQVQYGMYNYQFPGAYPTAGVGAPPQTVPSHAVGGMSSVGSPFATGSISSAGARSNSMCEGTVEVAQADNSNNDDVTPLPSTSVEASQSVASTSNTVSAEHLVGARQRRIADRASTGVLSAVVPGTVNAATRRSWLDCVILPLLWIISFIVVVLVLRRLALDKAPDIQG